MVTWGKVPGFLVFGMLIAAACGGRTGTIDEDYASGAQPGAGTESGGSLTTGGSSGGAVGTGGKAGARPTGGAAPVAGRPSVGGAPTGGAFATGGTGVAAAGGSGPTGGFGGNIPLAGFGGAVEIGGVGGLPIGGEGGAASDCLSCLQGACSAPLALCLQDFGCISIFGCAQKTGCDGFNCYQPDTCQRVIDMWGGPGGPSMKEVLSIVACGFQCQCQ